MIDTPFIPVLTGGGVPSTLPAPSTLRATLLNERQLTHGSFEENARISQALKDILQCYGTWNNLNPVHREALDMICLKISRIASGKAGFRDHWDDIAGYAKLASEICDA